jgi:hypothetical protein
MPFYGQDGQTTGPFKKSIKVVFLLSWPIHEDGIFLVKSNEAS